MKGEFEQRLRAVIDEVQASPKPIILFIDETHTLVGAGGAAGTGDAANLLKPALARGTLRTIGATTLAEYKKHIEKDPALTRRFQTVQVDEPDETKAILMMRGVAATMEKHHQVQILDEALEAAVQAVAPLHPGAPAARQGGEPARHRLRPRRGEPARHAGRGRRLPQAHRGAGDRAGHHRPREGDRHRHRQARGRGRRAAGRRARRGWPSWRRAGSEERALVDELLALRAKLRAGIQPGGRHRQHARSRRGRDGRGRPAHDRRRPRRRTRRRSSAQLQDVQDKLAALQGETPLILPTVDYQAVAAVVGDWTGIPVGRMATQRDRDRAEARRAPGPARHRPGPRDGDDRQAHPDQPRRARQPEQADRRVHARRHLGRRQDRDRAGAGRGALRRRAEPHHHQHERVPGGAHGLAR